MTMKSGDRWRCTAAKCGCEVLVECGGKIEGVNPRCACGATMKKVYAPPRLSYLEFLQLQQAIAGTSRG
jgi:hypothetical protein